MPYVISQPCIGCKDASCYAVCPVDAIHPTPAERHYDTVEQLYIDPIGCVDCGACEPECPVDAIWRDTDLPDELNAFIDITRRYYEPTANPTG